MRGKIGISRQSRLMLLFASFSVLLSIIFLPPLYLFIPAMNFLVLIEFALLIAYTIFLFSFGKERKSLPFAIAIVAIFILQFLFLPVSESIGKGIGIFMQFFTWLFFYIPVAFLVFFGFFIYKSRPFRHAKLVAFLFFAIAAVLLAYYNFSLIISWHSDDEMFIQMLSAKEILHLQNPYQSNYSSMLFYNMSAFGITPTTKNSIVGVLDYPALFPIVEIPFIILPIDMQLMLKLQVFMFSFILFMSIGYLAKKEEIKRPSYLIIVGILAALFIMSSSTEAFMLTLILFAYSKSGTKYGWLPLGLAASIQEMLWIPTLLLIVYTFANFGSKQGIKELMLVLVVFLAINGAFVIASPQRFFENVIAPATSYIIPNSYGLAGYLLAAFYPISLGSYGIVSLSFILLAVLLILYLNEKKLVFLVSLIPFAFLSHGIATYYSFFIGAFIISLALDYRKGSGAGLARQKKRILGFAMVLVLALVVIFIVLEHDAYASSFYMQTLNESFGMSNSTLHYNLTVYYRTNVRTLATVIAIYNGSIILYGINGQIISGEVGSPNPGDIDTNYIHLNGSGKVTIRYNVGLPSNIGQFYADPAIFNGSYVYYPPPIKVYPKSR
ncbi:MAG: hypothetical protein ACP5HW_01825 [Candidatus Micrarchaeia archaeon]